MKRTFLKPGKDGEAPTPIVIHLPRGKHRGQNAGAFGGRTKAKRQEALIVKAKALAEAHKVESTPVVENKS